MKSLREHITETQKWMDSPAQGDDFAINIREECLLESHILDVTEDAVIIEADDRMLEMLESYGMLGEEITLERIRRYGAVGSNRAQGFTVAEGDIDPNRHPQTRDYGRGDDIDKVKRVPQTRLDNPWDAVSDKPDSAGINPQPPMDYVQDSEQDFRRVLELAGVTETEIDTKDPLADKAAALAPVGADGEQEPVATVDETKAAGQHLSRIRELAGMAEEREDREWSNRELEVLNKAERDFKRYLDSVSTPSDRAFNAKLTKKRMATSPLAGPKGQLPEQQGVAEDLYVSTTHIVPNKYYLMSKDGKHLFGDPDSQAGYDDPMEFDSEKDLLTFFRNMQDRENFDPVMYDGKTLQYVNGQGLAESLSDVDMDLRHIAKTERMDALVDAMRGEFGIKTQQYLQGMMDEVEHSLQQRGQGAREDMRMKLRMLMDRIQEIYAGQDISEAEYQGRDVPLGKPMQGDVAKFKVYVKDPKTGNVKKVNFGDKTMRIKKSNPARRKSFRARHNCANPGPRTKARYWSCRKW